MARSARLSRDLFRKSRDGDGPGFDQAFREPMARPFTFRAVFEGIDTAAIAVKICHMALSHEPDGSRDDRENSKRQYNGIQNDTNDQLTPREQEPCHSHQRKHGEQRFARRTHQGIAFRQCQVELFRCSYGAVKIPPQKDRGCLILDSTAPCLHVFCHRKAAAWAVFYLTCGQTFAN